MQWLVDNKEEFEERQKYIKKLIEEKNEKMIQLRFEMNALQFIYDTLSWE